ncbi:hypothetical protein V5R04_07035 [Jonesiaceae bacterium BS-20]|uniref:Uncharacterized protein n=1 Tax=Jonesiaceae bacterium BS-20 TaxID=3120821 RepID=A0AAU7DYY4_9MICO
MTITALAPTGEVRQTSSTGGQKGTKPERYDLSPTPVLQALGTALGAPFTAETGQHLLARIMQNLVTSWGKPQEGDPQPDGDPIIAVACDALTTLARSHGETVPQ